MRSLIRVFSRELLECMCHKILTISSKVYVYAMPNVSMLRKVYLQYAVQWLNPSGSTRATKHEWWGENMHPPPHPMGPKEIDGVFVPPDKASTLLTYHLITG